MPQITIEKIENLNGEPTYMLALNRTIKPVMFTPEEAAALGDVPEPLRHHYLLNFLSEPRISVFRKSFAEFAD